MDEQKKINYWTLTSEELEAEAQAAGVPFDGKNRKETITRIRAAKGEVVEMNEDGKEVASTSKKNFVVVIFHNRDEQDLPFVYVGLNGKSWYIPKDKEVMIPKFLLNVIDDAVETRLVQRKGPDGRPYYEERLVHRFPYTIVGQG